MFILPLELSPMNYKIFFFFSILIFITCPLIGQINTENDKDPPLTVNRHNLALFDADYETQIIDLIAQYVEFRKGQNAEKLKALFIEESDQLVSSGQWRLDRNAMIKGMVRSTNANPGNRSIDVERVRFISDVVAIADAKYTIKGQNGNPDRNMWSTFVTVLKNDAWKIAAIRNMLPTRRNSN